MVKFLMEHLTKSGCRIGEKFVQAVHCDDKIAGGFRPGEGV